MSPAALLARVGQTLFGARWKPELADALGVRVDRLDDWSRGHGQPPQAVWRDLAGFIEERERALRPLKSYALQFADSSDQVRQERD